MESLYFDKMRMLGFDQLVCEIFPAWENVKDEILIPERKTGSGNGTIHVFLGTADAILRREFPTYYQAVENGEDPAEKAINITHYFLYSNVLSMLGHLCRYNYSKNLPIDVPVVAILTQLETCYDDNGLLSTKSLFKLSVGSSKPRPYFKQFDNNGVFSKIIRPILLPNSAYKVFLFKNRQNEYAAFWLLGFGNLTDFEADSTISSLNINDEGKCFFPLQTIFYGAPGTGKSYKIKSEKLAGVPEDNIFRTTFHPDYDYANFVGCYKPTKTKCEKQEIVDYITLVNILKDRLTNKKVSIAKVCEAFGYEFHDSIIHIQKTLGKTIDQLQKDAYSSPSPIYNNIIEIGMEYYERQQKTENKITYSFVPQVFTKAYVKAWNNPEQAVYLVIEEINRGNCAQIFGDLFQLLDRGDDGKSEYLIAADEDLKNYLLNAVDENGNPVLVNKEGIDGGKLCLPPNLNLLATMNTSDQSLFPMDSAFKRRWDWEFVPIRYSAAEAKDEKDNFHTFEIEIGGKKYKWTDFLEKVNAKILSVTDSEDKQIGEYFIKKSVDYKTFINKVMYYLWSEVGKDLYGSTNPFFVQKTKNENGQDVENQFSFNDLFKGNATQLLQGFMEKLEVKSEEEKAEEAAAGEE